MEENLQSFLAENAIKAENVKCVASTRFVDKDRKPIEWDIRVMTSEENDALLKECKKKVFTPGSREAKIEVDQERYTSLLVASCVVYPNLDSAALQDSYGAIGAESLLKKMLTPGEFTDLVMTVQEANGFELGMAEKIKKAKN